MTEALKLPNKTHWESPIGGEEKNKVVKEFDARKPGANDSLPDDMTHVEIAQKFDLIDFANAAKLSGNKFVFLKNEAAQLEMALCNWAFNLVAKKGFTAVTTPDLAR